jgi:putative flippase GtrA
VSVSGRLIELARFAIVGAGATLLYGAISMGFLALGAAATPASVIAYCLAGALSYCGHKFFTFASLAGHRSEAPRFLLVNTFGLTCALLAPLAATHILTVDAHWAIIFTCLAVPAFSYFAMKHLVFASAVPSGPSRGVA